MLMKHIGARFDSLLAIGGSTDTLRILPHLGFRAVGTLTNFVRVLRPLRFASGDKLSWRWAARAARAIVWKVTAPKARAKNATFARLQQNEHYAQALVRSRGTTATTYSDRSADSLVYLTSCPCTELEAFSASAPDGTEGYFVLSVVRGQVRLVDWAVNADNVRAQDWLLQCAVRRALSRRDATEILTWASDSQFADALRNCGFHARDRSPIQLRPSRGKSLPPGPFRLYMADNDAVFLEHGL
jgi:hypothetical protein